MRLKWGRMNDMSFQLYDFLCVREKWKKFRKFLEGWQLSGHNLADQIRFWYLCKMRNKTRMPFKEGFAQ